MEQALGAFTCCGGPLIVAGLSFWFGRVYERYQGFPWRVVRRDLDEGIAGE